MEFAHTLFYDIYLPLFQVVFGPHMFFRTLQLSVEQFLYVHLWNSDENCIYFQEYQLQSVMFRLLRSNNFFIVCSMIVKLFSFK
jgi:hypothetical protein